MFSTLTKRAEVASAQGQMQKALFAQLPERGRSYTVGFQGGKFEVANLHADGSIWCVLDKLTNELTPRFWNAFGLADKLKIYGSNAIVVEINVPLSGISSRVGGAFAVNESGELWLLHRGKVGGGKDGIGKDAFLRHSKLPLVSAVSKDGKAGEFIPVGHIASPTFASDVGRFVRSVAEFKKSVADDAISSLPDPELDLLARKGKKRPAKVLVESYVYVRDPFVVEFVKRRAAGRCELCGCICCRLLARLKM